MVVVVYQYTAQERTMAAAVAVVVVAAVVAAVVRRDTATQEQVETEHKEVGVKVRVQTDEPELEERLGKCDGVQ